MSDYRVRIPIADSGAESLNVAVAGGILIYLERQSASSKKITSGLSRERQ
jgi:tRNA G18 (ribose-2'-O)-methylase SpoU